MKTWGGYGLSWGRCLLAAIILASVSPAWGDDVVDDPEGGSPPPTYAGKTVDQWLADFSDSVGTRRWRQQEIATSAALERFTAVSAAPLADLLDHDDSLIRTFALRELRKLKKAAVPFFDELALLLVDREFVVSKTADQVVEDLMVSFPEALASGIELLSHKDQRLRVAMVRQMGRLGRRGKPALDALEAMKDDAGPRMRQEVEWAIASIVE